MRRSRFVLLAALLFAQPGLGQSNETLNLLPNILPASPEAASFAKFGNYAVNLFTGIPDISIPLYDIKVGELSVPISISYHASGIKVNDYGSWVGLGWNLNAGGSVTRKVMGKPDDQSGNYLNATTVRLTSSISTSSSTDMVYLRSVNNGTYDCEPDIFSYNFPGKSGKFFFNQANNYTPETIPYDPVLINRNNNHFYITDERGVAYNFEDAENTTTSTGGTVSLGLSTWVLTKMISSNKQDTVSLSYTDRFGQVSQDILDYFVLNDQPTGNQSSDLGASYTATSFVSVDERKIQEIDFRNGKILFDASAADRLDAFTGQKSLSDIQIMRLDPSTGNYTLLKKVIFYQSYFMDPADTVWTKRLRLDSLGITDATGTVVEKYKFVYNIPSISLPRKDSRSRDYWGYFNNKSNNTLVPQLQVPYTSTGLQQTTITIGSGTYNGRNPDSNYMSTWSLSQIYYPTGGHTVFTFETNQYLDQQNNPQLAGGLRIRSIANYDGRNTNPVIKTYKYGTNESGYGRANFMMGLYFWQTTQTRRVIHFTLSSGVNTPILDGTTRFRNFTSNPTIEIEPYDGSPVAYATVTEYVGDGTSNTGKTIYNFTDVPDALSTAILANKPIISSYHMNRGQLSARYDYSRLSNGTYQLVHSTANQYEAFPAQTYNNVAIVAFKTIVTDAGGAQTDLDMGPDQGNGVMNDAQSYLYQNYSIRSDDNRQIQTVETHYDQLDPTKYTQTWTHYYYDNFANQQVSRIYTVNSLGDTIKIYKKYPHDFSSNAPYNTMISLNNINKVVQEQKLKNTTSLTLQTNYYQNMGNGNYLPDSISYQVAANPVETRAYFNKYDVRGNILEMQKAGDAKQSIIWDYRNLYPIAQVTNAAQNQIAYTSFEADGSGNWSFGDPARSPEAITGNQSFVLNANNSIGFYFADATTNYIISYWSKDGAVTLGGVTVLSTNTGLSKSGWTYYEHTVTATTGGSVILTASSAKTIDELRLYPVTALMTSFTHAPLVGITSKCSENNTLSYYNYDPFNRLRFIRDANGNITKTIEYNYQQGTGVTY